jgi:hypothetical protein
MIIIDFPSNNLLQEALFSDINPTTTVKNNFNRNDQEKEKHMQESIDYVEPVILEKIKDQSIEFKNKIEMG